MNLKRSLSVSLATASILAVVGVGVANASLPPLAPAGEEASTEYVEELETLGDRDLVESEEPVKTPPTEELPDESGGTAPEVVESSPPSAVSEPNDGAQPPSPAVVAEQPSALNAAAATQSLPITSDQLCKSGLNGLVTVSGKNVTVDLSKAGANYRKLVINRAPYGKRSCLETLRTLTFTNTAGSTTKELLLGDDAIVDGGWTTLTFPSNMDLVSIGEDAALHWDADSPPLLNTVTFGANVASTDIGEGAFRQYTGKGFSNSLSKVTFGTNTKNLTVGDRAFSQEVWGGGDNALKTVVFNSGLRRVDIGNWAFFQEVTDRGRNALASISFPDGITALSIGDSAFRQIDQELGLHPGDRNALSSVSIPGALTSLNIGTYAFYRGDYTGSKTTQAKVTFRSNKSPSPATHSIILGDDIIGDETDFFWLGADNVTVAKAWGNSIKKLGTVGYYGKPYVLRNTPAITGAVPKITGTATVGSTLTANPGTWKPSGVKLKYQWLRDGKAISNATAKTYKTAAADKGKKISVKVTGSLTGAKNVSKTSAAVTVKAAVKPDRLAGVNRYETNYEVNVKHMKAGKPVFIATGTNFPDALSIGPVVALTGGSLVLASPSTGVPTKTMNLIKQRKPSAVYAIGGASVVSNATAAKVANAAGLSYKRVGGSNRYATSAAIFKEFYGNRKVTAAFVATGRDFPDALSASSAGGVLGMPVLLVNGSSGSGQLVASSAQLLKTKGVKNLVIVGGAGVVTPKVVDNIGRQGSFKFSRQAGSSRYATNMAVNNYVNSNKGGISSITGIWVATGNNFPDALSAAGPAGQVGQRLVLTNGSCLSKPVVSSWIKGANSKVTAVNLVGGKAVVGPGVANLQQCG